MAVPRRSEVLEKLTHHLREAQECAAMVAHITNEAGTPLERENAVGWLTVSEMIKRMIHQVQMFATKGLRH
ncbi:MAG: hypothetical protein KGL39_58205 [Patescibacteria group bacterium]|nr:hypothetical protein [Patescibacteria group bacterium]